MFSGFGVIRCFGGLVFCVVLRFVCLRNLVVLLCFCLVLLASNLFSVLVDLGCKGFGCLILWSLCLVDLVVYTKHCLYGCLVCLLVLVFVLVCL